jgi:hypothetical protein
MTPKTKYQKNIALIFEQLKPISPHKIKWGIKSVFDSYCIISRKTCFCLDCGYAWKNEVHEKKCPSCNVRLLPYAGTKVYNDNAYFSVIDTFKNHQIIRHFFLQKIMKKNTPYEIYVHEVMQHWIDVNGRITSFAKPVQGFGMYYDSWRLSKPMELQSRDFCLSPRYSINGPFYPKKNILPILTRNGFKGQFCGHTPQDVFSVLLSSPKAETLIKANQFALLSRLIQDYKRESKVDKFWQTIKICIRNNYVVEKAYDYFDHLELLEYFGKDLLNKKFVCPDNFDADHNRLVKKKKEIQAKIRLEEKKEEIEKDNAIYIQEKEMFFDLAFKSKELTITPLVNVQEFFDASEILKHCIFSNEYYKKTESLLFQAKRGNELIETLELDLDNMKIIQSRGKGNQPTEYTDEIQNLVKKNFPIIRKKVNILKKAS